MSEFYQELIHSAGQLSTELRQNLEAFTGDYAIKGYFFANKSVTWNSTSSGNIDAQEITVSGVWLGDMVITVSIDEDVVDATITANVTGPDTVTVLCHNDGGSVFNPGTTNVRLLIADVT